MAISSLKQLTFTGNNKVKSLSAAQKVVVTPPAAGMTKINAAVKSYIYAQTIPAGTYFLSFIGSNGAQVEGRVQFWPSSGPVTVSCPAGSRTEYTLTADSSPTIMWTTVSTDAWFIFRSTSSQIPAATVTEITSSGTYTATSSSGIALVVAGGTGGNAWNWQQSRGGNSGGVVVQKVSFTPGEQVSVTIGAGGGGGGYPNFPGSPGGSTTFGSITATNAGPGSGAGGFNGGGGGTSISGAPVKNGTTGGGGSVFCCPASGPAAGGGDGVIGKGGTGAPSAGAATGRGAGGGSGQMGGGSGTAGAVWILTE